jgi:hypothetical protein
MQRKDTSRANRPEPDKDDPSLAEELQTHVAKCPESPFNDPMSMYLGLSFAQIHRLLEKPFDSPDLAVFHPPPPAVADVPFMRLFRMLAEASHGDGLKATAKGNLPRNFCREAAKAYWGPEKYADATSCGGINAEEDFMPLSVVRHAAECAGMIHLNKDRWRITKSGLVQVEKDGLPGVFFALFRAYVEKLNWSVQDKFPEASLLQDSFLFTLSLLARHGGEWRMDSFYSDLFLDAFPMSAEEFDTRAGVDAVALAERFLLCYSSRVLERFAAFWGLAETEEVFEYRDGVKWPSGRRIKRLALLEDLLTFPGVSG